MSEQADIQGIIFVRGAVECAYEARAKHRSRYALSSGGLFRQLLFVCRKGGRRRRPSWPDRCHFSLGWSAILCAGPCNRQGVASRLLGLDEATARFLACDEYCGADSAV